MGTKNCQAVKILLCLYLVFGIFFIHTSQAAIPDSPSSLASISGNTEASLTWALVPGAEDYIIYRSNNSTGPFSFVGRTKVNCFADLSLNNDSTYYYVVTALSGDGESDFSDPVTATPTPAALEAPDNVKVSPGNGEVSLSWSAVTSAVEYFVYRLSPQGKLTLLTPSAPGLSFTDRAVTNGTQYHYVVQTMSINPGAYSSTIAATPFELLPKAPASLSVVPGDEWASLSWSASPNALYYAVYRSMHIGGAYTFVGSVTGTIFEDTDLDNDTNYYYVVTAINGNGSSAFSQEVPALPLLTLRPRSAALVGYARKEGAKLFWDNIHNAVSYDVHRSESSGVLGGFIERVTQNQYTDDGLSNGTTYYYTVKTNNASSEHPETNQFAITPKADLPVVENVSITPGNTQATISWDPVVGAYRYYVYVATSPGGTYTTAGSTSGGKTAFTETGLTNNQGYYFKVRADFYGTSGATYSPEPKDPVIPRDIYPLAPTSITGEAGNTQVRLRWGSVAGATEYQVYRRTLFSGWSALSHPPLSGTLYNDIGLTNGTEYFYLVAAINGNGIGAWATTERGLTPLDSNSLAPINVVGIPGNTQVTLTWDPVPGITQYYIQIATTPGGPSIKTGSTSNGKSCHTATGLTNGQKYYFRVRSYQPSSSMYQADIMVTPETPLPLAPTSLSGETANEQIRIRWNGVAGASDYKVYRRTANSSWTLVSQAPLFGTYFIDTGLSNGITYYYTVAAVNGAGTGAWATNEVSLTPSSTYNHTPTAISTIPGHTQATVTWNPVPGATHYSVQLAATAGGTSVNNGNVSNGKTSYTATGLTNEQTYYARVRVNSPIDSTYSGDSIVTPTTSLPEAPSTLSGIGGNTQASLTWDVVDGATGYTIYRRSSLSQTPAVPVGQVSGTLFFDSGLTNGTDYFYSISAVNASGEGAWSAQEEKVRPESSLLLAPANLSGVPGNSEITLIWDSVPGATAYYITAATTPGGPRVESTSATNGKTSATLTGLTNGQKYYVRVRVSSPSSSAEVGEVSLTPSSLLPLAPTSLTCKSAGNTQATIGWDEVNNVLSYKVYRRVVTGGWSSPAIATTFTTLYNDSNLINSIDYYYVVSAVNSEGEGAWSPYEATCTPSNTKPLAPENVRTTSGDQKVTLSWQSVSGAMRYRVFRAESSSGPYFQIDFVSTPSYIVTNLQNGQRYYFMIRAENSSNELSAYSSSVYAIPSYANPDSDHDGIADSWEMSFFDSLSVCDGQTDFDKDKYTDLQEYLNWKANIVDPLGEHFDPLQQNAPDGYGYEGILPQSGILHLVLPVIIHGVKD